VLLLQGVGAVASRRAAELYGLEIVDENINDNKDNVTRFIKLARWVQPSNGGVCCVAMCLCAPSPVL
jgi:prephenate dehydratase